MPATLLMLPPQTKTTHQWAERLALDVPDVSVIVAEDADKATRAIAEADCAFGTLPRAFLAADTRLRWLQAHQAAPPAGWYYPELIAHPVVVTNFREIYNDHIGTHIMAFVLAFARGLHQYLPRQLNREWRPAPLDTSVIHLPEATALVVGAGGIGAEAARLAAAFGMRVLAVDARRRDTPPGVAALYGADTLDSLLPGADFVILTVPHTPATEGFMNRARFQRMKRTAFFINIGRGMTTRLDDLVAALKAGEIAGGGARRLRAGAPSRRASALDHARCADHAAHRGLWPLSRRPPLRDPPRQLPALPRRAAAAERGRQDQLVLRSRHARARGSQRLVQARGRHLSLSRPDG